MSYADNFCTFGWFSFEEMMEASRCQRQQISGRRLPEHCTGANSRPGRHGVFLEDKKVQVLNLCCICDEKWYCCEGCVRSMGYPLEWERRFMGSSRGNRSG